MNSPREPLKVEGTQILWKDTVFYDMVVEYKNSTSKSKKKLISKEDLRFETFFNFFEGLDPENPGNEDSVIN
jgi:hypothetical protein